ncbi:apolipoprotein N-acyltransferase [bacterium]|nr:apolipoprotein N-acyltransferase [bacterium]
MNTATAEAPAEQTEATLEQESATAPLSLTASLALAALSVGLLTLAGPFAHLSGLAWIAAVPFLVAVRGQGAKRGAVLGLLFGWMYQGISLYWLIRFGLVAPIAAGLIKSTPYIALGAYLGWMRPRTSWLYAFTAACAWCVEEYIQSSGSIGFNLGMLANTQARHPWLLQIGSLLGPWALSFVIAMTNAAVADWCWRIYAEYRGKRDAAALKALYRIWRPEHPTFVPVCWALGLLAATMCFGIARWHTYQTETGEPLTVGLVQLAADQSEKFDVACLQKLLSMSRQAAKQGSTVIIWPETSMPYKNFNKRSQVMSRLRRKAKAMNAWLMIGGIAQDANQGKRNRIYALDTRGRITGTYDKRHLVPFGEFLPFESYWPDLPVLRQIPRFQAGDKLTPLKADGCSFGILICFESMITTIPRELVRSGAEVLAVPTNDGWFGHSAELPAHFDMAIMRAVETGRYIMQAGNTGISGFVDPLGRVLQESEIDKPTVMTEKVYKHSDMTLYMIIGDLLPYAMIIWLTVFIADRKRSPKLFQCL